MIFLKSLKMKFNIYKIRLTIAGIVGTLSILAVFGLFYPVKIMNIQFVALLQKTVFDFSLISVCLLVGIIVMTLLFGRFYCSTVCPFGILQEFFSFIKGKRKNQSQKNYVFKYLIASLTFGVLIGGSSIFIRYIEPFTIFSSAFSLSLFGIIATVIVLTLIFFKNRFFCTNLCPVGTILGFISKLSLNKIYIDKEKCESCGMCAQYCPSGCINYEEKIINNETCLKCLKCLNGCKKQAVKFGIKPIKFSPKRRDLLTCIGVFAFLGAGYTAGLNLAKNFAKKVKDVILPAGAVNYDRMANKCFNCNLCINHCPNKILVKADNNFPAVHIDYKNGKGYCEYECNKCNEICPSGAIKNLTLEQKQHTKIGAVAIKENCVGCGKCSWVCPTGAIKWEAGNKAVVDNSKCIGCGKCVANCAIQAINIFVIKKQSII